MVDIINLALLIIAIVLVTRFSKWMRKRLVLIGRLKRLCKEYNGEIKFLRFPFLPTYLNTEKPDISVRIADKVYLIRLYSGRSKYYMVHFTSERFSVRYMKMSLRRLASTKRRGTGIAYAESSKAFTVRAKVFVSKPMQIPERFQDSASRTEKILLFNPAPHAVSCVSDKRTSIELLRTEDEVYGMKIFTGSSFVEYAAREARKGDY